MDHHLMAHWTDPGVLEARQPTQEDNKANIPLLVDGQPIKQKNRRSLTEAERGISAVPNTLRPATTKAGKHRIRMKWSNEVNQWIMKTYYQITQNETQTKSYRDHLHRLFAQQYPDVNISQQRIADQRRAIVKNNLIPKAILDQIKEEVAESLQMKTYSEVPTTSANAIVKQELVPSAHIVAAHHHQLVQLPQPPPQQQQQPQQQHHQPPPQQLQHVPMTVHAQHIQHNPSSMASAVHAIPTSIHQASPTTAATLQNQPHIIIRVNSTNAHGAQPI